ncbi:YkvA family protein [Cobetia amphilecti]|uniref:YkvA family protein n=1 Tax=Cobetia amphilecti TaxID=1055104 RepID=UPI00244A70D3|nr:YkvA family protein [Cobetia litoralis]MDH2420402.1 YkvA family protein [Cobetia litoralis]
MDTKAAQSPSLSVEDSGAVNDESEKDRLSEELKEKDPLDVKEEKFNEDEKVEEVNGYEDAYSDEGFWKKTTKYAKKAGKKTLNPALKMYYSAQDPETPLWAKTTIYGALGYFISPVDVIPDITPLAGYTDDVGILAGAIAIVAAKIKPEHIEKAEETLKRWFS